MWFGADRESEISSNEILNNKISSNLNPYAKEFYPSWRIKSNSQRIVDQSERMFKDIRTSEILLPPQTGKLCIWTRILGLSDIKYTITHIREIQSGRRQVIEQPTINRTSKICTAPSSARKSVPLSSINNNAGAIKKPSAFKNSNCTSPPLSRNMKPNSSAKCSNFEKQGSNINSQPVRDSKVATIKPILKSKFAYSTARNSIPPVITNKDTGSIKSSGSSDKSYGVRFSANSSKSKLSDKSSAPTKAYKYTEPLPRSPRSTVASNLRKSEIQKRRNLFPHDPAFNIVMSDFLFK